MPETQSTPETLPTQAKADDATRLTEEQARAVPVPKTMEGVAATWVTRPDGTKYTHATRSVIPHRPCDGYDEWASEIWSVEDTGETSHHLSINHHPGGHMSIPNPTHPEQQARAALKFLASMRTHEEPAELGEGVCA